MMKNKGKIFAPFPLSFIGMLPSCNLSKKYSQLRIVDTYLNTMVSLFKINSQPKVDAIKYSRDEMSF